MYHMYFAHKLLLPIDKKAKQVFKMTFDIKNLSYLKMVLKRLRTALPTDVIYEKT